jgi:flagellar biosynthetic protein FlhB
MEHDDSQERTEEATEKRRRESKEKGSVSRSKDLNTTILLVGGVSCLIMFSEYISKNAILIMKSPFEFTKLSEEINNDLMFQILIYGLSKGALLLLPLFIFVLLGGIIGSVLVGGWICSFQNAAPKLERINPLKGLKKIFSLKSLVELFKSALKFVLVFSVSFFVFAAFSEKLIALNFVDTNIAISSGLWVLLYSVFIVCASLIVISAIDVPFQIWEHTKQIKMTKQEVKDEMKDTEGSPELKARIAKMQREQARRRMMEKIPEADVVITNPDHFAVALKYDESNMQAPILVAKGADLVAEKIKEIASDNEIPIVSIPPLARSVFYFTELNDEIPADLYIAVAQVLAYVYQLDLYKRGKAKRPNSPKNVPIPDGFKR